jgi:hypothetical protein
MRAAFIYLAAETTFFLPNKKQCFEQTSIISSSIVLGAAGMRLISDGLVCQGISGHQADCRPISSATGSGCSAVVRYVST